MTARGNHDDGRVSVRRAVVFGVAWAIGTITLNLLFTDTRVWIVIVVWSMTAVPVAALWWWLIRRFVRNSGTSAHVRH